MILKFESAIAGTNFAYAPGDVVEWPDEKEAKRFVDRGIAEEIPQADAEKAAAATGKQLRRHRSLETATRSAGERAVTR